MEDGSYPPEIDRIVNEMYGLDEEEIAIIKNETGDVPFLHAMTTCGPHAFRTWWFVGIPRLI